MKEESDFFQSYEDTTGTMKSKNQTEPVKSFGQRMNTFLNLFKKDKIQEQCKLFDLGEDDNMLGCVETEEDQELVNSKIRENSDEIASDIEDNSRIYYGRGRVSETMGRPSTTAMETHPQSPNYFKVAPSNRLIRDTNLATQINREKSCTMVDKRLKTLNDSTIMYDLKEGPRLNLPNTWGC